MSLAAPPSTDFPGTGYAANLSVTAMEGTNDHVVTWDPYVGDINVFGYDIYYGSKPTTPGANADRIETGATGGQWIDIDGRINGHCEPGNYFIVAYNRGRKAYSDPAQGSGPNVCDQPDSTAPELTVSAPVDGESYQGTRIQVFGTATDLGGSGVSLVTLTLFDSANQAWTYEPVLQADAWSQLIDVTEGQYSLQASATDVAGNESLPVTVAFTVVPPVQDGTAPVISISAPEMDATYTTASQLIEGTATDAGDNGGVGSGVSVVEVNIYPASSLTASVSKTVSVVGDLWSLNTQLSNGTYDLTVDAVDQAGNAAVQQSLSFSVNRTVTVGGDGYDDIANCSPDSAIGRVPVAPDREPTFQNTFDSDVDIHTQLQGNWKSRYEWRQSSTDVIINNESQFYLDVLGFDSAYRDQWSPFELIKESQTQGYLAINAAKKNALDTFPLVNGAAVAGQDYLSGVLTTFGTHSLSPSNNNPVVIQLRARMPRGQGVFPAAWLYNESFYRKNPEIDIFEYIGQSRDAGGNWLRPSPDNCQTPCSNAGRFTYDTYATQYHNYYIAEKGRLKGLSSTSVDSDGNPTGAVYTNSDSGTWWRGPTWANCTIDFSEKFHIYTLEWSADALVWYIDDVEVLRIDETADSGGNLPGVNFVPTDTRPMYLTLNFALGSVDSYIGSPDGYTQDSMDQNDLKYIIDYIKVWQ